MWWFLFFFQMARFTSFLRLNNNLLFIYLAFFIHSSIFIAWMLWIKLQWTWKYRYLFEILFYFLWVSTWGGIAGSYSSSVLIFWGTHNCFPLAVPIYIPLTVYKGSLFFYTFTNKLPKKKITKTIPFKIASKNYKILRNKLKELKDLYNENYKTWMKKIKYT